MQRGRTAFIIARILPSAGMGEVAVMVMVDCMPVAGLLDVASAECGCEGRQFSAAGIVAVRNPATQQLPHCASSPNGAAFTMLSIAPSAALRR